MRGNQGDLFEQKPRNHCVYYHRSYKKGVFYIGLGLPNRPFDKISRNRHWKHFVNKYGNYEVVILEDGLTFEEAAELEKDAIKFVGIDRLTNISLGGEASALGMRHSEESKRKISQNSASRRPNIRQKYSEIFSGSGNPMFGQTHSKDAREKIRKARTGSKATETTKLKMSISHLIRNMNKNEK